MSLNLRTLLIIDDEPVVRQAIAELASASGYSTITAANGKAGFELAKAQMPDLILCDVEMPVMNGYQTLEKIRTNITTSTIPFVFLTGRGDRKDIRDGMNLGANDYLTKPFTLTELKETVKAQLLRKDSVARQHESELNRLEEKLQKLRCFDSATGLPNGILLDKEFSELIDAETPDDSVAILILGIEGLQRVNDNLGSSILDIVLHDTVQRIIAVPRIKKLLRLENDRLLIMLPRCENAEADRIASAILELLAHPYIVDSHKIYITGAIGVSFYPQHSRNILELAKRSIEAMKISKQKGNDFLHFDPAMQVIRDRKTQLEASLVGAMERSEFYVVYQPKIEIETRRIVGAEALLRWNHPELGLVSPSELIPLVEENHWIVPIGEWIIETALDQLKRWHDAGQDHLVMSINLSPLQMGQADLVEKVDHFLEKNSLRPDRLEFEITETSLYKNLVTTKQFMQSLRKSGIKISIDDFGTGYSTLEHLREFPFDILKIDRSFISNLMDAKNSAIVSSVIQLAHSLKMKVIAEGVEDLSQLYFLKLAGCEELQGYLFSKPLNAEDFSKLLQPLNQTGPQWQR